MGRIFISMLLCLSLNYSFAQKKHDHGKHDHKEETKKQPKKDTVPVKLPQTVIQDTLMKKDVSAEAHDHGDKPAAAAQATTHSTGHSEQDHHGAHNMSHAYSLNLPMNRNGSGTGWLPDESPIYGHMTHKKDWMLMLHYNAFPRFNKQDVFDAGSRGDSKFDMPSWGMLMAQRQVGKKGLFHFSTMLSLDPIIGGGEGYPLLYQTGETFEDKPLVDRQHPHDLISELSVSYAHMLSRDADLFLYVGYPGEPAIGPVAFMHRPSAQNNPDASLTHHWTDATHITFGVATLGARYKNWKIEGSLFTGREPDENRYDFDKPRFDSYSGRVSFNPTSKWAMQLSRGFLKEPEPLHPGEDVNRTTASVIYSTRGYGAEFWNMSAIWGSNKRGHHDAENGILLEGAYNQRTWGPYFRYEWVQKSADELQITHLATHDEHELFSVNALTAGTNYQLFSLGQTNIALGAHLTFYRSPKDLKELYGDMPIGAQVYLRIYPGVLGTKMGSLFLPE